MFDFLLYPVSAILWFWHTVFAVPFGAASGLAWVLAVAFLVFTVRALLLRPALGQLRTARRTRFGTMRGRVRGWGSAACSS